MASCGAARAALPAVPSVRAEPEHIEHALARHVGELVAIVRQARHLAGGARGTPPEAHTEPSGRA